MGASGVDVRWLPGLSRTGRSMGGIVCAPRLNEDWSILAPLM